MKEFDAKNYFSITSLYKYNKPFTFVVVSRERILEKGGKHERKEHEKI